METHHIGPDHELMHLPLKLTVFITAWMAFVFQAWSQNLEEIGLKKGVKVNGSVNLNTVAYAVSGIQQRRDPFNWFLTGAVNVDLFGYAAPFSFSYSNANKNFSQPFNQFSFAPQYKWVKTYIGYSSMTFSPYTLAGHVFLGAGAELSPGRWRVSVMGGRLRKAVSVDPADTLHYANAVYERMGYGLKVGYETNGNAIAVNVFTAKDDPASLPFVLPENVITPQQNVAMGISARKTFFGRFFVNTEYAVSVLNNNRQADIEPDTVVTGSNFLRGLLPGNTTNRYFDAINASLGYQARGYALQIKYERVAPEYQTLGAYYFNNDMRNITVVGNTRLFNNKLTLGSNVGMQRNNLDRARASTSSRVVAAFNVQVVPTPKWSVAANYSNFSSFTKVRPPSDPYFQQGLDSLNFYQVSETLNGNVLYTFGNNEIRQNISFNASFQKASNVSSGTAAAQLSDFLNGSLSYGYARTPSNFTASLAITASTNNSPGVTTAFVGPAITTAKTFFNKALKTSWSSSYSHTTSTGASSSPIWSNQINLAYIPQSKDSGAVSRNNFTLNTALLRRLKGTDTQPSFTELTITANYSYTF